MVESIEGLRKICHAWEPRSSSERLYRSVSIYLTKILLHTPVTANQVTLTYFLVASAAGILFTYDGYWCSILGALLIQIYYLLDHTDGEIARYRGRTHREAVTIFGTYLDRLSHFVDPFVFFCISFGVYGTSHSFAMLVLGFIAGISLLLPKLADFELSASVALFYGENREGRDTLYTQKSTRNETENVLFIFLKKTYQKMVAHFDFMHVIGFVILICSIINLMDLALIICSALLSLVTSGTIYANLKRAKSMTASRHK